MKLRQATHLILFCTCDSMKASTPFEHMAHQIRFSLSLMVIVWQKGIWSNRINVSSPCWGFVRPLLLCAKPYYLLSGQTSRTNGGNRLPNPPERSWSGQQCQSVPSARTEITASATSDGGRKWKRPFKPCRHMPGAVITESWSCGVLLDGEKVVSPDHMAVWKVLDNTNTGSTFVHAAIHLFGRWEYRTLQVFPFFLPSFA